MNNKVRKKLAIVLMLLLLAQPVAAWGGITHMAITSKLSGVPAQVTSYPVFTRGGGVGPDMFYFLPGKTYYSDWAHYDRTADLPREMLNLSVTDAQKAYSYGWLSHCASDLTGHPGYVNVKVGGPYETNPSLHRDVEIGVDANLVNATGLGFSVPYGLIQAAYKNIYGDAPWRTTIYSAAQSQQSVIYTEKAAIYAGAYDDLKNTYNDFRDTGYESITYSISVINDPSILPNANLDTGEILGIMPAGKNVGKIDKDVMITAEELLEEGILEIPVKDDKVNMILYVGEPEIKNKKAFDERIARLVKQKTGR